MALIQLPLDMCRSSFERVSKEDRSFKTIRRLTKPMKSWLKNRDIEYSFEHVVERYKISDGTPREFMGQIYYFGQKWHFEERCELTIPDEEAALQFRLTWL